MPTPRLRVAAGNRFARMTVLEVTHNNTHTLCKCRCDCGRILTTRASNLTRGATHSCGCYVRDLNSQAKHVHGHTSQRIDGLTLTMKSPEYRAWRHAKSRCYNPNVSEYPSYGGRGIAMSAQWRDSFEAFYRDMGARPSPSHSIDRIDNDGPYAPENCRWATRDIQARNKRSNHRISYRGETLTLGEWANRIGINHGTLLRRINRLKWPIERALTAPLRGHAA